MKSLDKYVDEDLFLLMQNGDHAAFTELYLRYSPLLYAHAYNKLRIESEARDVVQEVFIRFWANRGEVNFHTNITGYLYTCVRNAILNLVKHKDIVTSYAEAFTCANEQFEAATDYLVRTNQFMELIEKEIMALPPRMRAVFELRRKEHLSNKEIALRLNITESTVADQMKKALRILRIRLGLLLLYAMLTQPCKARQQMLILSSLKKNLTTASPIHHC